MYDQGVGVEKDDIEAFGWYSKAAQQGNAKAQCALGEMYSDSRGVEQDQKEAIEWFRKSAAHGNKRAKSFLEL